jgi:hypothetical protein
MKTFILFLSIVLVSFQEPKKITTARVYFAQNSSEILEINPINKKTKTSSVLNELDVQTGMSIYLFSDGYADQFGGEAGKKFKVKNLSQLLLSIHAKPLNVQKEILDTTFDNWKKHLEQVDDVSLIGIRF